MPPSPTIKATVDENKLTALCSQLRINPPKVRLLQSTSAIRKLRGTFFPGKWEIIVYVGFDQHSLESLRIVQAQIVRTLLHELRHAYQAKHWTSEKQAAAAAGHYAMRDEEADANEYAAANAHNWVNLVIVRRSHHRSGFSQLARHDQPRMV